MGQIYSILKKFTFFKMRQRMVRRRLPSELEWEIFQFLGRGIYETFGTQLFFKSKRLHNPKENHLNPTRWNGQIFADGMKVAWSRDTVEAFAHTGFDICVQRCRMSNFPGTILYYFEVTQTSVYYFCELYIGLSNGHNYDDNVLIYYWPTGFYSYYLFGEEHPFEWSNDAIKPRWNGKGVGDVYGCGLLLNSMNELAIFFTYNGILMGKQITISPQSNHLIPTIRVKKIAVEVNFGDDPAKPFKFDIHKCQGLVFQ